MSMVKSVTVVSTREVKECRSISSEGRLMLGSDHGRHLRAVTGTLFPAVAVALVPGGIAIAGMGGVRHISLDAASGAIKP